MPRWNESFEITPQTNTDSLDIRVMDDAFIGDDPVGCCTVNISELNTGAGVTNWFTLLYKDKDVGQIQL